MSIAVDIGGSLAKVVYFEKSNHYLDECFTEDGQPSTDWPQGLKQRLHSSSGSMIGTHAGRFADLTEHPETDEDDSTSRFFSVQGMKRLFLSTLRTGRSWTRKAFKVIMRYPDEPQRYPELASPGLTSAKFNLKCKCQPYNEPDDAAVLSFRRSLSALSAPPSPRGRTKKPSLPPQVPWDAGRLHFVKFETRNIEECVDFIAKVMDANNVKNRVVPATGGGAYKYAKLFNDLGRIRLLKTDEMQSIIIGLNYLLKNVEEESFLYQSALNKMNPKIYAPCGENVFPYLLVHIGSGVSIIKVDGERSYERISGTSLGGGTFLGLCQLLTNCTDFDDLLKLCAKGDNTNVDMLVGDIYGTDYTKIGLKADTIASSFGKILMEASRAPIATQVWVTLQRTLALWLDLLRSLPGIRRLIPGIRGASCGCWRASKEYRSEDVAMGVLRMVSNNIAQIAYLNALRFSLSRIYFGGYFIREHRYTMDTISYGVNFWSSGSMKALFLQHDGYLGALGALVLRDEHKDADRRMTNTDDDISLPALPHQQSGSFSSH